MGVLETSIGQKGHMERYQFPSIFRGLLNIRRMNSGSTATSWTLRAFQLLLLVSFSTLSAALKQQDFKTCSQSGFCTRQRAYADLLSQTHLPAPYSVIPGSIELSSKQSIHALIQSPLHIHPLTLTVEIVHDGIVHVMVDESGAIGASDGKIKRYQVQEVLVDSNASSKVQPTLTDHGNNHKIIEFANEHGSKSNRVVIQIIPFAMDVYLGEERVMSVNRKGWLNVERQQDVEGGTASSETTESAHPPSSQPNLLDYFESQVALPLELKERLTSGLRAEVFGTHIDSKPFGPMSFGLDVTFVDSQHVYGIPEHATRFLLNSTR